MLAFPVKTEEVIMEKKERDTTKTKIKISNKLLSKQNASKEQVQTIFIDLKVLHDKIMEDSPDFYVSNMLIQSQTDKVNYNDFPKTEEELEKYEEKWDLEAKALIHAMNYIPVDVLTKVFKYMETFKAFFDEFDANGDYPLDQDHEYFKFFKECKAAANKLKEEKNKKEPN